MAAPDNQPVSMLQGLQRILAELGSIMAAPDADVAFLTALQHAIVDQIKKATTAAVNGQVAGGQQAVQAQQIAPGGGAGMSGFGGAMGQPAGPGPGLGGSAQPAGIGSGGGPPMAMGAPGPGGMGPSNVDELRRLVGGNGMTA